MLKLSSVNDRNIKYNSTTHSLTYESYIISAIIKVKKKSKKGLIYDKLITLDVPITPDFFGKKTVNLNKNQGYLKERELFLLFMVVDLKDKWKWIQIVKKKEELISITIESINVLYSISGRVKDES